MNQSMQFKELKLFNKRSEKPHNNTQISVQPHGKIVYRT